MFFGAAVDKGMGMWGRAEGHPCPAVFGEFCSYFSNLRVIEEKMICQVKAECFDGGGEMIFGQCVHRIFHGIGGQDLRVIAGGVYLIKVSGEGYIDGDMPDLMPVRVANDLGEIDRIFPISVLI